MIILTTALVDNDLLFLAWRENRLLFSLRGDDAVVERLTILGVDNPRPLVAAARHGQVDIAEIHDPQPNAIASTRLH